MSEVFLGDSAIYTGDGDVTGGIVERDGETFYRIGHYDRMQPFFIAVVSGFNHWMYVSSTGGLTCGRRHPGLALFPYETDDRIHDACNTAGPVTAMRVNRNDKTSLWEPFGRGPSVYRTERNLYKSLVGNRLVFEEINHSLEMVYEYEWATGDRFGFIRKAALRNSGQTPARVELMDGLRNLLPHGTDQGMQANFSTLLNAYRQAEVHAGSNAALFTLSSVPTDRAEPSESLKTTIAWNMGFDSPAVLLSCDQLDGFRRGGSVQPEHTRNGRRCDYVVHHQLDLDPGQARDWYLLADVAKGPSQTVALLQEIESGVSPDEIKQDIGKGTRRIRQLAGRADAFQFSSDELTAARHFSNTLFNIMRGGVFQDGRHIQIEDFKQFLSSWNSGKAVLFNTLPAASEPVLTREALVEACDGSGDADLLRLAHEYLPLTFSRRHGDPSRPWNHFDIDLYNPDGSDKLWFQGNWRDIFQNWEALSHSYPDWISHFISKFVNASTADGYNPYRITRDGIDWEVHDPDDPWSNIGYWGDHQVNYLLKLLEFSQQYQPGELATLLDSKVFVYADVPYRIMPYRAMLNDPRDTVKYERHHARQVEERVLKMGADGRLVMCGGEIHRVNLLEKLLVMTLVKLGNLVPGGGIWMNTQRPEWNDANNALVGYGLSMVTLSYLRRLLVFLSELLSENPSAEYAASSEVGQFFAGMKELLLDGPVSPGEEISNRARKQFMDRAGEISEVYREQVYRGFSGETTTLSVQDILALVGRSTALLDDSITANRRPDGLYHSYNLLQMTEEGCGVEYLQEMLEGQVAVLSSGVLKPEQSLDLLDSLHTSDLFRPDQNSYILYPAPALPGFLEKNLIDPTLAEASNLVQSEKKAGRTDFIEQDMLGQYHFNGRFRNAGELKKALEEEPSLDQGVITEACDLFEKVFSHRRFTGRSGAMYKYEGLGCIYWHMVSKLLLALAEILPGVPAEQADVRDGLLRHYDQVKQSLGAHKNPADYGAFPMDPYSHTPAFAGVQQPGMTGQVKEDFISRLAELGVQVREGQVSFYPTYLKRNEFSQAAERWHFMTEGEERTEALPPDSLAFCICGVPVIYRLQESAGIRVHRQDEPALQVEGLTLPRELSRSLFRRDNLIDKIEVSITANQLR